MKAFVVILICISYLVLFASGVVAEDKKGNVPLLIIQHLAGIHVGLRATKDAEVIKKHGNGFFVRDEGHGGGRYFTDRKRTVTLHTVIGVDRIIEEVELTKGLDVPAGCNPTSKQLISSRLESDPKIDKGLHLGMTPDELLEKLGPPNSDKQEGSKRIIKYETESRNDPRVSLFYSATFIFMDNGLIKVSLYDGC